MKDCIFCQIVAGKSPSYKVYEDNDTVAFLELRPSAPGHTMAILKKHGYSILDYHPEALGKLMSSIQKLAESLKKSFNCDWISIGINHFEPRGVKHFHIHLIPRWNDDQGGVMQTLVYNPPNKSKEEIAEKIRKNL